MLSIREISANEAQIVLNQNLTRRRQDVVMLTWNAIGLEGSSYGGLFKNDDCVAIAQISPTCHPAENWLDAIEAFVPGQQYGKTLLAYCCKLSINNQSINDRVLSFDSSRAPKLRQFYEQNHALLIIEPTLTYAYTRQNAERLVAETNFSCILGA